MSYSLVAQQQANNNTYMLPRRFGASCLVAREIFYGPPVCNPAVHVFTRDTGKRRVLQRSGRLKRMLEVHRVYKCVHNVRAWVARLSKERQAEEVEQAEPALEVLSGRRVRGKRQTRLESREPFGIRRNGEVQGGREMLNGGRPGYWTRVLDVQNASRGVEEVENSSCGGIDRDPGSIARTVGDAA